MKLINRIFYINIGSIHPAGIPEYLEEARDSIRCSKDPLELETYFIPIHEGDSRVEYYELDTDANTKTKIEPSKPTETALEPYEKWRGS